MLCLIFIGLVAAAFATELPTHSYRNAQRIVGGSVTDISRYPEMAALLISSGTIGHRQFCGGTILNQRSILSATQCFVDTTPERWQVRLGSTNAHSGGVVYNIQQIINHPQYGIPILYDNDIAILRTVGTITYTSNIRAGSIAGPNYNLGNNQVVWATGWGYTSAGGSTSEQLREVQLWSIHQEVCEPRFGRYLTDNMLCAGWLDVGGRGQCRQDTGGPLFHNGVVVGVYSWDITCANSPYLPGVYARVSRYTAWIQTNA